jgi:hypothetical protein
MTEFVGRMDMAFVAANGECDCSPLWELRLWELPQREPLSREPCSGEPPLRWAVPVAV